MYSEIVIKAKKYIEKLLANMEKEGYLFHNLEHSLNVFKRASYLAKKEWLDDELREILELSALFHDTWFLKQYDKNEAIWAQIAEEWLKKNNYPEDKIDIVKSTILATDPMFKETENILQKIIKDSDLDNLWRDDFWELNHKLHKEITTKSGKQFSYEDFLLRSWKFIGSYNFLTKTQQQERGKKWEQNKKELLEKIKQLSS